MISYEKKAEETRDKLNDDCTCEFHSKSKMQIPETVNCGFDEGVKVIATALKEAVEEKDRDLEDWKQKAWDALKENMAIQARVKESESKQARKEKIESFSYSLLLVIYNIHCNDYKNDREILSQAAED